MDLAELTEAFVSLYAKFYTAWLASDVIITLIYRVLLLITQSTETFSQLIMGAALGAIPPPFQFLVIWEVDPLGFLVQLIFSIIILAIAELRS